MADDSKKTAAARGKQPASRAKKTVSSNASPQIEGQRARRSAPPRARRARGLRRNASPRAFLWVRIA